MTHRTVHEWGRVDVGEGGFTRHQADALLGAARAHALGGADGTNILCDHHRYLRARQMAGVIAADGCSLEILPKVDPAGAVEHAGTVRARLVHMLDVALGLGLSTGEATAMAHRAESLLDVFVALFADRLLSEARRGLPRLYRAHEDDLGTLRGRLDVARQFTVNAVRPDRLACRFDALDADVPLLRIMKACVLLAARHARSAATQRKLAELRFLLADVRDIAPGALPWREVRIDRTSRRWRLLLDLARLLLGGRWQQTHAEARAPEGVTLLFPMNELFERYIAAQLRRALAGTGLDVVAQGGFACCLGPWREGEAVTGDSHPTRPDILVRDGDRVVAVLDTKWKHLAKGVSHADVYQMMAYARLYDCPHLILLYPAAAGERTHVAEPRGIPPGPDRLQVATVALDRSADIGTDLRRVLAGDSARPLDRDLGVATRPAPRHGFLKLAGSGPAASAILAAALLLTGCQRRPDTGAVVVSAIGGAAASGQEDAASRLLADATAQGLVRFDAAGQIEPGLAQRWIVIDGGMSYIFRLREAAWSDGTPVTAEQVVALLKRSLRRGTHNPLAPYLTAIDEIVVMTPQVIEVRLSRPRPDLLKLFAQPEMALARAGGSGPMRVVAPGPAPLLRPAVDPGRADPDDAREPAPEEDVRLIGERAARAVARFAARESDLVAGGTFADWPLVGASGIAPANVRMDPAAGLFGLAVTDRSGFLGETANRLAVAQAIDRAALAAAMGAGWEAADHILPEALDSAAPPATPAWTLLTPAERVAAARAQVARWREPVRLRIALPRGPGATLLWGRVAASLLAIGVRPERVAVDARADLRLVDAVAPYDSARWYLATACDPCGEAAEAALEAAREAPTLAARATAIAAADRALDADAAFITLARPLRWSLVARRLEQWQPNARAWHPLNRLRRDTR